MINKLLGAMLAIVVGVALVPTVLESVDAVDLESASPAVEALIDLLPILFVVILVAGAVAYIKIDK